MHARRSIAGAAALLFAAACSGTATQSLPTSGSGALPSAKHVDAKRERAKLSVRLKIPRRHKRAHYISPNTQSIVLLEGATTLGTFNTTPSSGNCAPVNGGTICSFKVGILTGASQTFVVRAYDRTNGVAGGGKLLSSGSVVKTIVPGMNVIPVTLGGVVSSIAVAVQNPNTVAGTSAPNLRVTVMASDPDGNTIVGPGAYENASGTPLTIALSNSDTSGVTVLSAKSVAGPNDRIVLNYNGGNVTKATIDASAAGVAAANVTPGVFQPTPVVTGSFQLPNAIGTNTGVPTSPLFIITGPDGNLWFTDRAASSGHPKNAIVKMTPAGAMTQFVPGTAPSTNLPDETFNGLAAGPDGNVWYASFNSVGFLTPAGAATDYPLSGLGVCSGSPLAANVVAAQDGGLWFAIDCGTSVQLLHMTTGGTPTVSSLPAGFDQPASIIVGQDHKLYIAGADYSGSPQGAIVQVTISGTSAGTSTMLDVPSGALNPIVRERGLTQTPNGDLWVANDACAPSAISRLHLSAGFSAANVTTFPTLAGCSEPANLMALADGSIWVPENDYPEALQLLPTANEGAPSMFAVTMPTPQGIYGDMWAVAATSDGTLYFTDDSYGGSPNVSGNIFKVVY
ncbi:MAG TPA: hypothetical protein VK760_09480 [Candidatus Acidoferrales bacterium]|nr:hypothetical protein [Candidatus Acidoferrales bacterium]